MNKIRFAVTVVLGTILMSGCNTSVNRSDELFARNSHELYTCNSLLIHEKVDRIVEVPLDNKEKVSKNKKLGKIFAEFDKDIPYAMAKFKKHLEYLKNHPRHVQSVLKNASGYIEMIYDEARKNKLPPEVVIIPMIESMYNPNARSPGGQVGMWQFTAQTALNFGLKVAKGIDERKDPKKSTRAAIKYLAYLYKMVDGDLDVAVAAYNAGEGRVRRLYEKGDSSNRHSNYDNVKMPDFTRGYLYHLFAYSNYLQNIDLSNFKMLPTTKKVVKKDIKHTWVSILDFAKHHDKTVREIESREMIIDKKEQDGQVYCDVKFSEDFEGSN